MSDLTIRAIAKVLAAATASRARRFRMTALAPMTLLPVLLAGCILIPIPHKRTEIESSRRMLEDRDLQFLQSTETPVTRADVLLELGEPDLRWRSDRLLVYSWTTTSWVLVGAVYGNSTQSEWPVPEKTNVLICRFDEAGRLDRWEVKAFSDPTDASGIAKELWETWAKDLQ